jgi:hypothetical protein
MRPTGVRRHGSEGNLSQPLHGKRPPGSSRRVDNQTDTDLVALAQSVGRGDI